MKLCSKKREYRHPKGCLFLSMERAEVLKRLKNSRKIVFFGGAGTSVESGIPDFRSAGGIYSRAPEDILSSRSLLREPENFFSFYRKNLLHPEAKPNIGHEILAKWEAQGRLLGIITQNIDGLHQEAGSKKVYELHGSVRKNTCLHCGEAYLLEQVMDMPTVPRCHCGGMIRPEVVLFGEGLDSEVVEGAVQLLSEAEILLVAGTSLVVYPAAGFLRFFGGDTLIMNNLASTSMDSAADLLLREGFCEAMALLDASME